MNFKEFYSMNEKNSSCNAILRIAEPIREDSIHCKVEMPHGLVEKVHINNLISAVLNGRVYTLNPDELYNWNFNLV